MNMTTASVNVIKMELKTLTYKETKKELMILVKTKGKTLSEVIRTALEEYAKKK